jgi:hypothetical protein
MRTADSMFDLGYDPVLITDANGMTCQHLTGETFRLYDHRNQTETDWHREAAWWDHRMTRTINPDTIVFPVTVVWEES